MEQQFKMPVTDRVPDLMTFRLNFHFSNKCLCWAKCPELSSLKSTIVPFFAVFEVWFGHEIFKQWWATKFIFVHGEELGQINLTTSDIPLAWISRSCMDDAINRIVHRFLNTFPLLSSERYALLDLHYLKMILMLFYTPTKHVSRLFPTILHSNTNYSATKILVIKSLKLGGFNVCLKK